MPQSPKPTIGPRRRGANIYFIGSGVAQASALLRYVVLARMLGPEQLGLAATLVLTGTFFDLISDTGSDRFLIQDREGDTSAVQKLVHLVYIGRGVSIAAALSLLAWPISLIYRAPPLAVGLIILSLSPLILGFLHLDLRRFQRNLDFQAEAICMMAGEITGLVATSIAAYITHSFTAILFGLISRAIMMVAVSHILSQRPYEVGFSREHSARLTRFAAPLMLNGLLMFFATQGDRALVGNRLGFVTLGRYSAVLLLVYYPATMIMKYLQAMYLPLMARSRDDPIERGRMCDIMGGQTLMLALAIAAGFAIVAPFAVKILYGSKFTETAVMVALIGILQTSRFLLVFPNVLALSVGRSGAALAVNIVRLVAYPAAILGGLALGGLAGVLAGFIFGELIGHGAGLILLNQGFDRPRFAGFDRLVVFVLAATDILAWAWSIENRALTPGLAALAGSVLLIAWIIRREQIAIDESLALGSRILGSLWRRPRTA